MSTDFTTTAEHSSIFVGACPDQRVRDWGVVKTLAALDPVPMLLRCRRGRILQETPAGAPEVGVNRWVLGFWQ